MKPKNKDQLWWLCAIGMLVSFWAMKYITPVPFFASFVGLLYVNTKK